MNPDSPFTVHGDETLEARIVAWVLGEASAFEEAELERLCEERPELLVFRRRMRALHGLLTEAEKQQPDEGWKLPEEKRKVLDEIFGETKVVRLEAEKEKRVRHTGRGILLAIAASVVIGFVVLSSMPTKYESVATLEVRPRTPGMTPLGASNAELSGTRSMSAQFFGTEFEIIKSRNNLEKVVDDLNLQSRWNVDKETALAKLKGIVDAQNIKGTDFMSIRVRSTNKEDARDIAEAVAKEYKSYRESLEREDDEKQLLAFRKAVQEQEDKVEERRKVLSTIARTKGIIYKGSDSFYNEGGVDEDQGATNALSKYHRLEQEKIQLESQINSLLKYGDDQQMVYASGLDLPDNIVKNLYPQYLEAKRQLEAQKINGLGEDHPTVLAAKEQTERMKKQLDEGVVNLRDTLKAKLDLTSDRFKTVQAMKDDTRDDAIKRGLDAQDYVDAKRDFETDQELLQQMKLKLIAEDTSSEMQRETVKIHEQPVDGKKVGPLQSIFGLFGNREGQANAELAEAKSVRFSTPAPASAPAPAQMESDGLMASRSLEGTKEKMVPLRPEFPPELIEGTPKPIILPPIADAPADAGLAMQPQAMDLAARSKSSNRPAETSELAGKLDAVTGTALPKGEAVDRKIAAAALGGAVVESKPESGNTLGLADGYKLEAPAQPAKPASQPMAQAATAAPAADSDTDLAKLMSGGEIAGVSPDASADFGFARPSRQAADGGFTNPPSNSYFFSGKDLGGETDRYADASKPPSLSDGATSLWESTKEAEFAAKDKAPGQVQPSARPRVQAPTLSDAEGVKSDSLAISGGGGAETATGDDLMADPFAEPAGSVTAGRRAMQPETAAVDRVAGELDQLAAERGTTAQRADVDARARLLSQVEAAWEVNAPEEQAKIKVERETLARNQTDAPELPNAGSKAKAFPVTPATPSEFKTLDEGGKALAAKQQAAKPDLTKLFEEVASIDEPYSTFSLNISDASFQIAQAAMAKGGRPDPAGVKVEQFYNAVDYGDPAPAAGEPVAVNIEQSAHPVIPGRNLVRVALKTAAAGRAATQPLHLTLLVDQSGSMSREDRRTAMKQALGSLGGLLSNNDSVTVVGFSRTPHLLADGLSGDQSKKLPDLINVEASEGGTNLEEAMKLGEQLAQRHKQPGAQNRIVLFTDGAANLGNADPEKLAERVKQLRQKGIAFDIAGIAAADLNDELLAELARNGNGRYYVVGKGDDDNFAKQLAGAFRPAAENVKVQVHFNPERVSRYKLIGFEKDRLKTEDFRNDAVDAAEMAAEEAGVAIYQIEPIPGGKGEMGEVSVRFRDTASAQMVERTWTISHNTATPAFDRATPSMQLATFAMLAAEKLKGGAFAEAIDFKQFSGPQANVKQFYGEQGRPAEVLRMVDALK